MEGCIFEMGLYLCCVFCLLSVWYVCEGNLWLAFWHLNSETTTVFGVFNALFLGGVTFFILKTSAGGHRTITGPEKGNPGVRLEISLCSGRPDEGIDYLVGLFPLG